MTLLPIVGRELRVAARRKGVHVMRTLVVLGVLIAAVFVFLELKDAPPQRVGQTLFIVISSGLLLYCVIAGPLLTADCLSEEKREGTLGLLFLTDLKGYDVVLGKLATTSINAIYILLAVFPALALPLLLGGVTAGELQRVVLVCLNTLFLSLTAGLFISSVSLRAQKAAGAASGLMLALTLGLPASGAWLEYMWQVRWSETAFATPSPIFAMITALDRSYRGHPEWFWISVSVIHSIAWVCLVLACVGVRRTWHDKPKENKSGRLRTLWRAWLLGSPAHRQALRRQLLAVNPYFWRTAREQWKPRAVWLGFGVVGLVWLWGMLKYPDDWSGIPTYLATAFLMSCIIKGGLATEAGNALGEDRRNAALELVLVTPLTVREIVQGQSLALRRQFFAPGCLVLALCFVFLLLTLVDPGTSGDERANLVCVWMAGMVVFVADGAALAVVGMWQGLTQRQATRATANTAALILVLPWVVFCVGLLWLSLSHNPNLEWWAFLALWLVPSLVADVGFGLVAWKRLHAEFRFIIAERRPAPAVWWRWWVK